MKEIALQRGLGGGGCFESGFALGAGGKVQSSPFGKVRLGSAPAPHALSIFSFIQRQTELLPLPLLVCDTFLRQLFHSAEGLAAMTPGVQGQRTGRLQHFSALRGKAGNCSEVVLFFFFFFKLFPPMRLPLFFFFLNQGKHLKPCFSKAVFFIQLFGSYSTVPSALYLLLKSSDDCVSHSLSEEPQDNGD